MSLIQMGLAILKGIIVLPCNLHASHNQHAPKPNRTMECPNTKEKKNNANGLFINRFSGGQRNENAAHTNLYLFKILNEPYLYLDLVHVHRASGLL